MQTRHHFFREKAVEAYMKRQEKDILPRFLFPYITILTCLLFALLFLIGFLAWQGKVPLFLTGPGVVSINTSTHTSRSKEKAIVLFLPAKYAPLLHPGEEVELRVIPTGQQFTDSIKYVEAGVIRPAEAQQRYMLNGYADQIVPQASIVVILLPNATNASHLEMGEPISAQVRVGEQSIFSFCLGLHEVMKER